MMRIVYWLNAFLLVCSFSACKYSNDYHAVNAGNKFSLAIPEWLKEDKNLKPGADFQYANRFRNFYAIGETLGKTQLSDNLQPVMHANLDILRKAMKNPVVTDSFQVSTNGLQGVHAEIYGKMNDENIYFSEVLLRGKNGVYHLSIWTRGEERKLKFNKEIEKILNSFQEKN